VALVCLALTFLFTAATIALFQRAYPLVDVDLRLDRAGAIRQARALAAADQLAPAGARPAASFARDDSLATYVDLAAGGADAVRALARNGPVPLYVWAVRLYTPGATDEVTLRFTATAAPPASIARSPRPSAGPRWTNPPAARRRRRRSPATPRRPRVRRAPGALSPARTSRSRAAGAWIGPTASTASEPTGRRCGWARPRSAPP
jgi:hypothetical protein